MGGKKRREKAERSKKHTEYVRAKKRKMKEGKAKSQAPVKRKRLSDGDV
ncbi:MAG: hypothetical protein OEY81_05235 [Candidatus Bathyarchaeota archaeon]|nr:hypothetical protein [Candidatus Bathyarchaeota archaeon]